MKISNIVTIESGQRMIVNSVQHMKVELYAEDGEVILRQFVQCRLSEVCQMLNFRHLPAGNYFIRLEGKEFTKYEDLEIHQ